LLFRPSALFSLDFFHIIIYKYIYMKYIANIFGLLSDETRIRILMLLQRKELCVCQLMGVLGISQPLISRNLSLLRSAGFLDERREGKMIFYSVKKDMWPTLTRILKILKEGLRSDITLKTDLKSLSDCNEFQKKTGKCDMKTFLRFMDKKKRQIRKRRQHAVRT
jgi:ArsR family transcriptional regulator, arsenate/arsenite/antimonite-responsive transcriptional repressor